MQFTIFRDFKCKEKTNSTLEYELKIKYADTESLSILIDSFLN